MNFRKKLLYLKKDKISCQHCQYEPYTYKYKTIEPKESDLIGTYVFEKQTFDYEITKFKDSLNNRTVIPKIEINSNGTYRILNLSVLKLLTQIISE